MKKFMFLALISAITITYTNAQTIQLGIKGGLNMTKITGQSFKDGFEQGFHAGAFLDVGLSDKIGIQPEVVFNQINTKRASGFNDIYNQSTTNNDKVDLSYLTIPILLRYNLSPFLSIEAGPQYGILINDNENLFDNGRDAFKKGNFSAVGGASIRLSKLRIYGRYAIGLNNINDIDNKDEWKSQQLQAGIGLAL